MCSGNASIAEKHTSIQQTDVIWKSNNDNLQLKV